MTFDQRRLPSSMPFTAAGVLALLAMTTACGGAKSADTASSSGTAPSLIRIDGSSTVYPITEAVAEEFQRATPGARVTVGISGTGGGFQKFCRAETDISNASRPIRATELEACAKSGVQFIEIPIAYDGLTVVIHPKNTWAQSMTVADLKRIWEPGAQGKITRWNQVRTDWPDREIHLFGAGVDSGTFDYFTEAIVGKEDASRGDYTSSEDDNMLVQGVSGDESALGFFGFAYFEENKNKLRAVAIDNGDNADGQGPIAPSPETIRNGTYRPLSRPLFIYINVKSLDRPEIKAFLDFYVGEGQSLVREVGYVALSDTEFGLMKERLARRALGTMFEGHSTSAVSLEALLSGSK